MKFIKICSMIVKVMKMNINFYLNLMIETLDFGTLNEASMFLAKISSGEDID